MPRAPKLFRNRRFEPNIILTCVRWYFRFSLSLRDLEELMTERGLSVDHTTIWRWTQAYGPRSVPTTPRQCEAEIIDLARR
jgi:transposase-like protein